MFKIATFSASRIDSYHLQQLASSGGIVRIVGRLYEIYADPEEYNQQCVIKMAIEKHIMVIHGMVSSSGMLVSGMYTNIGMNLYSLQEYVLLLGWKSMMEKLCIYIISM